MSDVVDDLYEAIEKAKVKFRGVEMSPAQRRKIATGDHSNTRGRTINGKFRDGIGSSANYFGGGRLPKYKQWRSVGDNIIRGGTAKRSRLKGGFARIEHKAR